MEAFHKNFQVIMNVHTFDGKNAAEFIEWYQKTRSSLNIYDKAALRVLRGAPVPSAATDTDGSKLVAWNTANEDLYNVLFFTTKGSACSVVRRFAGKTLDEGSGHGQRAWATLREKFDGCSRKALRAEHAKMNSARVSPGQDPDEFLYSPRTPQCVRPSRGTDGPSIRGHHLPSSSAGVRAHPHIPPRKARLRDRRYSPHDVRYLRGQPCPFELDDGDCGARGCHARDTRQPQRHHLPLLRTRGLIQEHVSPPRQRRAAATTTKATERTA